MRAREVDPDRAARAAFVLEELYAGGEGPWHAHRRAQLVHAGEGAITIATEDGKWVAPPERAVWVPAGKRHAVASRRAFRLLTLYVDAAIAPIEGACRVVAVDPLARELLREAARLGTDYALGGAEERLVRVLLDRLPALEVAPLHLPRPASAPIAAIADAMIASPADKRTLGELAKLAAIGERTAARRFVAETSLTFGEYRTRVRLLAALERLGAGESVTEVAFEVGYDDPSSFIAAFKAELGATPARYFASRDLGPSAARSVRSRAR